MPTRRQFLIRLACLTVAVPARAAQPTRPLITVRAGDCPLVLTAPHGGPPDTGRIPGVPPRTNDKVRQFTTTWDMHTGVLAEAIADHLAAVHDLRPFLVKADFNRRYIDANRPPEGAFEDEAARRHYEAYHAAIREAVKTIRAGWGRGLLVDVHGQGRKRDTLWRGTRGGLTVQALKAAHGWAPLHGEGGLFHTLSDRGYPIFPETPDASESPLNGGHTVATYGSHQPDGIDAVQMEIGTDLRRNQEPRTRLARDLGDALAIWMKRWGPVRKEP